MAQNLWKIKDKDEQRTSDPKDTKMTQEIGTIFTLLERFEKLFQI